jgi:hypothetical protein
MIFWNQLKPIESQIYALMHFVQVKKGAKSNEKGKALKRNKFQTMKAYLWEYFI